MIKNYFCLIIAILQIGASISYVLSNSPKLAGITFLYAICNIIFSLMDGI